MTAKNRRPPISSKAEQVRIMAGAAKDVVPPDHVPLRARELPFFDNIIKEFARAEWSSHQIELAAMLARMMSDMVDEHEALRSEGSVIKNAKGTPVMNPRRTVLQMCSVAILNMRRSLSLNADVRGMKSNDKAHHKAKAKEIEEDNPLAPESLLAVPGNMNRQAYNKAAA